MSEEFPKNKTPRYFIASFASLTDAASNEGNVSTSRILFRVTNNMLEYIRIGIRGPIRVLPYSWKNGISPDDNEERIRYRHD